MQVNGPILEDPIDRPTATLSTEVRRRTPAPAVSTAVRRDPPGPTVATEVRRDDADRRLGDGPVPVPTCQSDRDWVPIGFAQNLLSIMSSEQRRNSANYKVSADLHSNKIDSIVTHTDGSKISAVTTWKTDNTKLEFDTKLSNSNGFIQENTVSLAPNASNNHLSFSSLTKDGSGQDLAKHMSDVIVNETCSDGDHTVAMTSNERTPVEESTYMYFTKIFNNGEVGNRVELAVDPTSFDSSKNRFLNGFAGKIKNNTAGFGFWPFPAPQSFTTDR